MKNVIVSWCDFCVLCNIQIQTATFVCWNLIILKHLSLLFDIQICMVHKLGYGNWDELKAAFRTSPLFRFDWFVKSRTTQELARRCDTLIRLVEKENQEYDERERQARKEKKLAKVCPLPCSSHYQSDEPSCADTRVLVSDLASLCNITSC